MTHPQPRPIDQQQPPPVIVMPAPDQKLQSQAIQWPDLARGLKITDHASYQLAASHLMSIKALCTEADNSFDPIIRKAHEAHKEALTQKKRITDPLAEAERLLKSSMGQWLHEQEQIRLAEERRLREEQERQAAEQREAEIEEAEAAEASVEEVQALIDAPLQVTAVYVPTAPRISGISARETWKAEVTSLPTLVAFVAKNPQFIQVLQVNTVALNGLARSLKHTLQIPGVKVSREAGIAARRR